MSLQPFYFLQLPQIIQQKCFEYLPLSDHLQLSLANHELNIKVTTYIIEHFALMQEDDSIQKVFNRFNQCFEKTIFPNLFHISKTSREIVFSSDWNLAIPGILNRSTGQFSSIKGLDYTAVFQIGIRGKKNKKEDLKENLRKYCIHFYQPKCSGPIEFNKVALVSIAQCLFFEYKKSTYKTHTQLIFNLHNFCLNEHCKTRAFQIYKGCLLITKTLKSFKEEILAETQIASLEEIAPLTFTHTTGHKEPKAKRQKLETENNEQ